MAGTFEIKVSTKKSDIGVYFTNIADTMTSVKEKLQDEVVKNGKLKT
ncbi:variable large family protein (plasmid) [Borrelia turicatae 91E135]|nr:variable large family protein [Borrelia turicatae]UPA14177.1 variable large family protein [Borrelia turicatae 91E135]UPA14239.1 variable large family protein [Borrelia turicatae 91E135]